MRHSTLRLFALAATSTLFFSACGTDAATPQATVSPSETGEPTVGPGGVYWAAGIQEACQAYKQKVNELTAPIFESEGEPDGEVVQQLFADLVVEVQAVVDAVAAAEPPAELTGDRDEFAAALDAQVVLFESGASSPEEASTTLQSLSGPFTDEAGGLADAAGLYDCGSGTTFEEADFSDEELAAAAHVGVAASEYQFDLDGEIAAGKTVLQFRNDGGEQHEVLAFRLAEGTSFDDAVAYFEANVESDEEPDFIEGFHGGFAGPGGRTDVAVDFTPGTWMLICFIPGPDEEPHFLKGMVREVTIS